MILASHLSSGSGRSRADPPTALLRAPASLRFRLVDVAFSLFDPVKLAFPRVNRRRARRTSGPPSLAMGSRAILGAAANPRNSRRRSLSSPCPRPSTPPPQRSARRAADRSARGVVATSVMRQRGPAAPRARPSPYAAARNVRPRPQSGTRRRQ